MSAFNESSDNKSKEYRTRALSSNQYDSRISDGSVNLLEVSILKKNDIGKKERVKDAALTRGGIILVTEKGECHIAMP